MVQQCLEDESESKKMTLNRKKMTQPLDRNEGRANRMALGGFSPIDLQMIQFNSRVSVDV